MARYTFKTRTLNCIRQVLNLGVDAGIDTKFVTSPDVHHKGKNSISEIDIKNSHKIKIISLNKYIRNKNIERINAIKIDVEGYEYKALKGARDLIERDHPLLMLEMDDLLLKRYDASIKDIFKFLKDRNYAIWDPVGKRYFDENDQLFHIHRDIICY